MAVSADTIKNFEIDDENDNKVIISMTIKDYMFYKALDNIRKAIEKVSK